MANKTQQTSGNVTVPEHARKALQAREVGNFLSNYAIIIIISIMVLAVGFSKPNFWTLDNGKNLIINIAPGLSSLPVFPAVSSPRARTCPPAVWWG